MTVLPWLLRTAQADGERAGGGSGDPRLRALTDQEIAAVVCVGLATLVLGVIGLLNSFAAVADAARGSFGVMAWTVPLAIDIGILVFSALDLVLARLDLRVVWLRLVPWSLVGVTVYLNIADERTWFGRIAHAALPAMWVAAVEIATHAVRVRAGLASARRMDRIRASRWLLAPLATTALWRRMVLWEVRSYPDALGRERSRLLALTRLQDEYGRIRWRWKAPRRERALYRLGELTPARPELQPTDTSAASATPPERPTRRTPTRRPARQRTERASTDTGMAVARLRAEHPDLSAAAIAERLGVTDRTVRRHLAANPAANQDPDTEQQAS